ncbi:MAG: type II toxin-antitoxin system RelE/ParE family toxin [Betaproteobacteria bacterium]
MAEYRLLVKPSAAKEIESIGTKRDRQRIVARIQSLATEPRPPGCDKLAGLSALFRIRQGQYRIIYSIDDMNHIVVVIKVGHRGEVYRSVP